MMTWLSAFLELALNAGWEIAVHRNGEHLTVRVHIGNYGLVSDVIMIELENYAEPAAMGRLFFDRCKMIYEAVSTPSPSGQPS